MSLLDNASLILTPNAGKTSKLYSVIPSNGNGDFTVTRATTATRVNAAGLVDLVPYNLFNYSEMFSDSIWTKAATTISTNTITAPNGTLTADTLSIGIDAANARHRLFQLKGFEIGTPYTYSVYLKQNQFRWVQIVSQAAFNASAWCSFDLQDGVIGNNGGGYTTQTITDAGNGWWRISVTATAISTANSDIDIVVPTDGTNTSRYPSWQSLSAVDCYYVWGAQLVEGTSARDYLRTETRLNIPRLDYSLGSCPNLLLEPQRTNLCLYSEQFDNAWWSKSTLTITSNTTISPSGILNADTLDEGTTSSIHRLLGSATSITIGSNNSFSLYVKKGTMRYFRMVINDTGDTSRWICAQFDLDTQTFTTNAGVGGGGTIVSASIQSVGNGWFRVNLVGSLTITGGIFPAIFGSDGTAINPTDGRGGVSYLGTNKTLFIWGAQLEAGAYATSYIPTTTASVTRNSDIITRDNVFTNGLISASGGTWFVELRNNVVIQRDSATQGIFINTGTSATIGNGITIRSLGGLVRNSIVKIISGIATTIYTTTSNTCKIAIKWNGTTADVFENGVKVVSATSFTPTAMQNLIGDGSALTLNINQMALWATPLTDDQLELLTGDSFNTYAEMASFYNYTLQ